MAPADPNRCERAFVGNTIGQANAVSDKILDLRFCMLGGKDLSGKTLSGKSSAGVRVWVAFFGAAASGVCMLHKGRNRTPQCECNRLSSSLVCLLLVLGSGVLPSCMSNDCISGSDYAAVQGRCWLEPTCQMPTCKRWC